MGQSLNLCYVGDCHRPKLLKYHIQQKLLIFWCQTRPQPLGALGIGFNNAKVTIFFEGGDGEGYVLTLVFLGD